MTVQRIELPPKLIPVFTGEADYRGAYGGRGSAKTRSFAKMTAVEGSAMCRGRRDRADRLRSRVHEQPR
jgi:hypothetical protein